MATGKIKKIVNETYGYIAPDIGSTDVKFLIAQLQGQQPVVEMRVEYEARRIDQQRLEAKWVRPLVQNVAQTSTPAKAEAANKQRQQTSQFRSTQQAARSSSSNPVQASKLPTGSSATKRFLNPYNFVRYLKTKRPDQQILGNCPPPPHDRYTGLSGVLTCQVTNVTPLFVADAHDVTLLPAFPNHFSYHFFRVENAKGELEPALPATSLRGMVRSIFETATNSCFGVFDGNHRFEFRAKPEYGNKLKQNPGIVRKIAQSNHETDETQEGKLELCQVAKVSFYYKGKKAERNLNLHKPTGKMWQTGDYVVARAIKKKQGWIVREMAPTKAQLGPLVTNRDESEEYVSGWLKITGKGEDTNKWSEALFLDPKYHKSDGIVGFSEEIQAEYNTVLKSQVEQGDLREVIQEQSLTVGNLVWAEIETRGKEKRVARLARIQVPRLPYNYTILDLLPPSQQRCNEVGSLCPACRTFGWVAEEVKPETDLQQQVAYAGRVQFSLGRLVENEPVPILEESKGDGLALAILGTPKPTTTTFYLLDKNYNPGQGANQPDYNDNRNHLRGRKFYRHFGEWESWTAEQKKEFQRADDVRDNQNRTLVEALAPGAKFEFQVYFENLQPAELGALVWSLQLENGMYHRLGFAKPLGFGSLKLSLTKVQIFTMTERYQSLTATLPSEVTVQDLIKPWVEAFKTTVESMYCGKGMHFGQLDNIVDLTALLSQPESSLLVHYPRQTPVPTKEGENFRWFMGNKRRIDDKIRQKNRLPAPEYLPLAVDDNIGMECMDKDGG